MPLEAVAFLVPVWIASTGMGLALCVAAKRGDEAMRAASRPVLVPASEYAVQMREQSAARYVRQTFAAV
jgi:hypothetical protein